MEETKRNSSNLAIIAREGFFHAMLSYRVATDAKLITKIHDKLHLLAPSAGKSGSQLNQLLDSPFPLDAGFKQDPSTYNSSLHVFLDTFCLKDGVGWEGDGGAKSGGFVGAVRLSPVFVPLFSATKIVAEDPEWKGSIGQMIKLAHKDMQDNVLLELIVARELHLMSKQNSKTDRKKVLAPCSYIFPLFRTKDVWTAASSLPKTASVLTNDKAKKVMEQMGVFDDAISPELRNGTLTVQAVWQFFTQFQGIHLHAYGEERFQVAAAANAIIGVVDNVRSIVTESKFDDLKMNSSQIYELSGFMSQLNMSNYTPILAIHHVSNMYQLAELKQSRADAIVQSIAEHGVRASDRSTLSIEYLKLVSAIHAAQSSPLAKPLNNRFRDFIDHDASFVTLLSHSSLFDIILSKKIAVVLIFIFSVFSFISDLLKFVSNSRFTNAFWFPYLVFILSCFISILHSPRLGRYILACGFLSLAILVTSQFVAHSHDVIYGNCSNCHLTPQIRSTMTTAEIILHGPSYFPMYWGIFFCSLLKQQWTFPVLLLCQIFNILLTLSSGWSLGWSVWLMLHLYNVQFWVFISGWSSIFLILLLFRHMGNKRAQLIYELNSVKVENAYTALSQNEETNRLSLFAKPCTSPSSEPQPSQFTCLGIFARKQQNSERTSQTEMRSVIVPGETSNFDEIRGEEAQPLKTTQEVQTASQSWCERLRLFIQTAPQSKQPGESLNMRISTEDIFKTESTLLGEVLQDQRSFEKLIKDAEFTNDAFQEWVSSWLSGGPDLDAVQKYLYFVTEHSVPQQSCEQQDAPRTDSVVETNVQSGGQTLPAAKKNSIDDCFWNLSDKQTNSDSRYDPIKGKCIRGPLKRVDRAIAKVIALFCISTRE
jgi:hypothetical protein